MDRAVIRFEDSPVLLPKRIHLLRLRRPRRRCPGAAAEMQDLRHRRADRRLQEGSGVGRDLPKHRLRTVRNRERNAVFCSRALERRVYCNIPVGGVSKLLSLCARA